MRPFKNKELCTHASPFAMSFNHTLIQAGPHHFQPHMKQQLHTTAHNELYLSGRYFHTAAYQFLHQVEGNKSMMIDDEDWQSERRKSFCFIFGLSTLHSKLVHMALLDVNYLLTYNDGTKVIRHPTGFVMCCTKMVRCIFFGSSHPQPSSSLLHVHCSIQLFFGIPVDHKFLNNNNNNKSLS